MTVAGMVARGDLKSAYHVPASQYVVLRDDAPLDAKLERVALKIKAETFDWTEQPLATLGMAHEAAYGGTPGLIHKCSCKHTKNVKVRCKGCKCAKANRPCSRACMCNGNCSNPHK